MNKLFIRYLSLTPFLFIPAVLFGQTTSQLIPKKGLFVTTNKLTWITGSEINFLTPQRNNHHYYFTWWEQDELLSGSEDTRLLLGSQNTAVYGVYQRQHTGNSIRSFFDCRWNLKEEGIADILYAKLWLPYLQEATWSSPKMQVIKDWDQFHENTLFVTTPFGSFKFSSSQPFKVKLSANLQPDEKEYTTRSQYLILYEEGIPVNDSAMLQRAFFIEELKQEAVPLASKTGIAVRLKKVARVWNPGPVPTGVLPRPKQMHLSNGLYSIPKVRKTPATSASAAFNKLLQLYWQTDHVYPGIITRVKNQLAEEGYEISITKSAITIQHKTEQGLQHALQTLVQLVKNNNGRLVIPQGIIKDEPALSWRGIHMFTGPVSWPLHKRMYDRILLPLKMNKVVLQCEQAQWESRPEVHNSISVPMKDLKAEFDYLRLHHNEPIPLIQSLGHMEWFFKPKQNRFMAVNPDYPYTLNPDLPASETAVKQLWDETFDLLKPKTMHIGFDEIGMIGFHQPREREVEYFKTQINFLHKYAQQKNAKLMLWGDMGLGPGEGPDALNGVTKERAAAIRSFIPKGTYVADWHYINNPNPEIYKPSLKIWKQNDQLPLASPWLWPDNVSGFVQAAIDEKAGVLQTTWADFESSEQNMLLNIEQFGAYILAMDYAWSGRKELPEQLPYTAIEEWVSRFYSQPKPVTTRDGYKLPVTIQLKDITSVNLRDKQDSVLLSCQSVKMLGLGLKATTASVLPEGVPVAEIRFLKDKKVVFYKTLRYGVELRAVHDKRMIYAHTKGLSKKQLFIFYDKPNYIDQVSIVNLHPASGIRIDELIIIE